VKIDDHTIPAARSEIASGRRNTYRKRPRTRSRALTSSAIPTASANCTGMITTIRTSVTRNASVKRRSFTIVSKASIVQTPFSRNASPNAWTVGQAKKSTR
jgi:hypothetical protein